MKIILKLSLALVLISTIGYFGMKFYYQNKEIDLSETLHAKVKDSQSHYTKLWEVITNKAGVSKEYAKNFKEIYPDLIAGRYSKGQGQLMNWIKEHNPEFDTSLYKDLMVSIEGQRESFHNNQRQLIDISRQHNVLLRKAPSRWFLSDVEPIEIPVIINDAAEEAFKTGKEKPMNLFN